MRVEKLLEVSAMDGDVGFVEMSGTYRSPRSPGALDRRLGARIHAIRRRSRLTLADVAAAMGCSSTQVWKYEKGRDRMYAATIYRMACALGVRVEVLLGGIDSAVASHRLPSAVTVTSEVPAGDDPAETAELLHALHAISNCTVRRHLLHLVKVIAEESAGGRRGAHRGRPSMGGLHQAPLANGPLTFSA